MVWIIRAVFHFESDSGFKDCNFYIIIGFWSTLNWESGFLGVDLYHTKRGFIL